MATQQMGLLQRIYSLFAPKQTAPYIPPTPAKPKLSAYDNQMATLDRIQKQLNPMINSANRNATMIHNYVAGNTQYPSYNHPNVGGKGPASSIAVAGTTPSYESGSAGPDYSQYAQYIPYLQQMANKVMQQRMPQVQDSVDLSPYTAFAENVRNRSTV